MAGGGDDIRAFVNTPFQEIFEPLATFQNTRCEDFEYNLRKCQEAFGIIAGRKYCDLEMRDLKECVWSYKGMKRWQAIRWEREKQFVKGERDRPFERGPCPDIAYPDHFDRQKSQM